MSDHDDTYDHTHDISGNPIRELGPQTRDALASRCPSCGVQVQSGHADPLSNTQGYQHARSCPNYTPHPASIAAHRA